MLCVVKLKGHLQHLNKLCSPKCTRTSVPVTRKNHAYISNLATMVDIRRCEHSRSGSGKCSENRMSGRVRSSDTAYISTSRKLSGMPISCLPTFNISQSRTIQSLVENPSFQPSLTYDIL